MVAVVLQFINGTFKPLGSKFNSHGTFALPVDEIAGPCHNSPGPRFVITLGTNKCKGSFKCIKSTSQSTVRLIFFRSGAHFGVGANASCLADWILCSKELGGPVEDLAAAQGWIVKGTITNIVEL